MKIKIKEQSWFARIAAYNLKSKTMAAVLGNTIHLWNVKRDVFLQSIPWVVHEVEHVRQFNRYGFLRFAILYLVEYARNGYHNNRFEIEARGAEEKAEENSADLSGIEFI